MLGVGVSFLLQQTKLAIIWYFVNISFPFLLINTEKCNSHAIYLLLIAGQIM